MLGKRRRQSAGDGEEMRLFLPETESRSSGSWLFTEQTEEFFHNKQIIILQHVFKHQIQ
jgi:hypothetical protein